MILEVKSYQHAPPQAQVLGHVELGGMPNEKAVHVLMNCTVPNCNPQSNTGLMYSGCQLHQESSCISAGHMCLNLCNLLHRKSGACGHVCTHAAALYIVVCSKLLGHGV